MSWPIVDRAWSEGKGRMLRVIGCVIIVLDGVIRLNKSRVGIDVEGIYYYCGGRLEGQR